MSMTLTMSTGTGQGTASNAPCTFSGIVTAVSQPRQASAQVSRLKATTVVYDKRITNKVQRSVKYSPAQILARRFRSGRVPL